MEAPISGTHAVPYTILRIKRKRNEEPLDALVVEDKIRRKKSKGGMGVFQYAQTVEEGALSDAQSQQALQDAISKLSQKDIDGGAAPPTVVPSSTSARQTSPLAKRRYTIIEVDHTASTSKTLPDARDAVKSTEPAPDFKMYDAVPSVAVPEVVEEDPEMVKFQSMLSDYLSMNDVILPPPSHSSSPLHTKSLTSESIHDSIPKPPIDGDEDYVWDIFYHRPTSLSEWNDLANVGMLSTFPSSLFDEDYDSDSESEREDEADEDSNEEDFYRNDYPDEETDDSDFQGSSDEYHEHSEYDDDMGNIDEDEQFDF